MVERGGAKEDANNALVDSYIWYVCETTQKNQKNVDKTCHRGKSTKEIQRC